MGQVGQVRPPCMLPSQLRAGCTSPGIELCEPPRAAPVWLSAAASAAALGPLHLPMGSWNWCVHLHCSCVAREMQY